MCFIAFGVFRVGKWNAWPAFKLSPFDALGFFVGAENLSGERGPGAYCMV